MEDEEATRLTATELIDFFGRLFPNGFCGPDVTKEIAPEEWENSPLLACFHPSPQQVLHEQVAIHRRALELRRTLGKNDPIKFESPSFAEPTLEEVLAEWKDQPDNANEEVTELVGLCLWDVFSDNHTVIAADGRIVDIGSFHAASAFLDEYLAAPSDECYFSDEFRFYLGSIGISRRADLTPVYRMIFARLKSLGADWKYHFPRVYLVGLSSLRQATQKQDVVYSASEAFAKEQEERERQIELQRMRADLDEIYKKARREAMDRPPPHIIQAYQEVYGQDPAGWPPLPTEPA